MEGKGSRKGNVEEKMSQEGIQGEVGRELAGSGEGVGRESLQSGSGPGRFRDFVTNWWNSRHQVDKKLTR